MKQLILYILFILITYGCQKPDQIGNRFIEMGDKRIQKKDGLVLENGKPLSGRLYELNPNGKDTLSCISYLSGKKHGLCKEWYPTGELKEVRQYQKGMKHGLQVAYWPGGLKKFEFTAEADQYEGQLKEWSANGSLIHQANFVNGQESGAQKLWYENGKIRANYTTINGRRYGLLGTKNCRNVSDSVFRMP